MTTVKEQLATCWDYIVGAGAQGNKAVWVLRNEEWLIYTTLTDPPLDQVKRFDKTDDVRLYATQDCVLSYQKHEWQLATGWNTIHWPIKTKAPGVGAWPWLVGTLAAVGLVVAYKRRRG